jgi:hypothetical protein
VLCRANVLQVLRATLPEGLAELLPEVWFQTLPAAASKPAALSKTAHETFQNTTI